MTTLAKCLGRKTAANPTKGSIGKQTDWLSFEAITNQSGKFMIIDPAFAPEVESGLVLDCPTGAYQVEAKVLDFGGDRRISRLRAVLKGANPSRRKAAGEVFADVARIGICDFESFSKAWDKNPEKAEEKLEAALDHTKPFGQFTLSKAKPETTILYVDSGFGDGTFPVQLLLEKGKAVGFEVEFIAPRSRYPFESGPIKEESETEPRSKSKDNKNKQPNVFREIFKGYKPTNDKEKDFQEKIRRWEEAVALANASLLEDACKRKESLAKLRRAAPPLELELRFEPESAWSLEESLRIEPLRKQGFEFMTRAQTNLRDALVTVGFRGTDGIVAEVYHDANGTTLALHAYHPDGRTMIVLDSSPSKGIAFPKWRTSYHHPGTAPTELLEKLVSKRHKSFIRKTTSAQALEAFKALFRRTQMWRAERGGPTMEELKQQHEGKPDPQDPDWYFATWWQAASEQWLYNWLKLQNNLPFDPALVGESLVIIHDGLDPTLVRFHWIAATLQSRPSIMSFDRDPAREAFAKVNQEFGAPLQLVYRKTEGRPADYYLPKGSQPVVAL